MNISTLIIRVLILFPLILFLFSKRYGDCPRLYGADIAGGGSLLKFRPGGREQRRIINQVNRGARQNLAGRQHSLMGKAAFPAGYRLPGMVRNVRGPGHNINLGGGSLP